MTQRLRKIKTVFVLLEYMHERYSYFSLTLGFIKSQFFHLQRHSGRDPDQYPSSVQDRTAAEGSVILKPSSQIYVTVPAYVVLE